MTALRITRSAVPRTARAARRGVVFLAALGLFGCGTASPPSDETIPAPTSSPGANDPVWFTNREKLPAPDTDRIEYDADNRLLKFHPLPNNDRWMVRLPDESVGRFVSVQHRLREGVDIERTLVCYFRPGAKVSATVTVKELSLIHI